MPPPINDSAQVASYGDYHNDNTYALNPGRLAIPCCNGSPVVVQVHKAFSVRTQNWSAVKKYTPPVLPAPDDETVVGSNSTLLAQSVAVPMAQPMGGGSGNTYRFAAAGTYQYLETVPTTPRTGYPCGKAPWFGPGADSLLQGAGGVIGGVATFPMVLVPNFTTGQYSWPFACIAPAFFDPTLSAALDVNGAAGYTIDTMLRG